MVNGKTNRLGAGHSPETCCAGDGRPSNDGSAIGLTPAFQGGQAHQRGGLGRHGTAYFEGASMSQAPAPLVRPKGCCGARDPR